MTLAGLSPAGALIVRAGEPFALQVGYVDEAGDLLDLTGRLFALAIRYTDQTAPLLTINAELDGEAVNAVALGTAEQASQIYAAGVTRSLSYDFMELTGGATASRLTERVAVQPGSEIPGDLVPQYMDLPMLSVTVAAQRKLVVERGRPGFGAERRLYDAGLIDEPTVAAMDERYLQAGAEGARPFAEAAEAARDEAIETVNAISLFRLGFSTRDAFIAVLAAASLAVGEGQTVQAAGLTYIRLPGATAIPDLPGWLPAGDVYAGHFGFVGVGTRADTLKLTTSAFAYLHSLGGGTLHFTAGLFLIGNTNSDTTRTGGNWDNQAGLWVKHDNIRLKGAGENVTILRLADGQDAHVLKFGQRVGAAIGVSGCGFSDLTIDGNRDNQTPADQDTFYCNSGVDISAGCSDFLAERFVIHDCQWYAKGIQRDDFTSITIRDGKMYRLGSDGIDAKGDSSVNNSNIVQNVDVAEWGLAEPATLSAAFDMRGGWLVDGCKAEILPTDPIAYPRIAFRLQDTDGELDPTAVLPTYFRNCEAYGGKSSTSSISGSVGFRLIARAGKVIGGVATGWNHGVNASNPDCFVDGTDIRNNYKGVYGWQDANTGVGAEADQLRVRATIRNNFYGIHLDSVDNATVDSTIAGNDTGLWVGTGSTNTRVRGEVFGNTTTDFVNDGTGTSLLNVAGITTRSKRTVSFAVDAIAAITGTIAHQLAVTPDVNDVTPIIRKVTNVTDYRIDFVQVTATDATNISYTIKVGAASASPGATASLLLVSRALEF
ncbi:hypothetical protein [Sphingobium sp. R-7]|uniref:hypothetical protein n=1 Tax=Sphingobium sp. R-7 TaxID=3375449 RepID=UPI00398B6B74